MKREAIDISVRDVVVKEPVRREVGDLGTLQSSIERLGVLCPIIVNGESVLIAGRRRLEACRNLGIESIPAVRIDVPADGMVALDVQCDENLCRLPLSGTDIDDSIARKKGLQRKSSSPMSRITRMFGRLVGKDRSTP